MSIYCANRKTRRLAKQKQKRAIRSGYWGEWVEGRSPKEQGFGHGWANEFNTAFKNDLFAVLCRPVETRWGSAVHIAIKNATSSDIPWAHKQRIKNELFGDDRIAIEVFPTEEDLVDAGNMYHLWIMPLRFRLPFTLK